MDAVEVVVVVVAEVEVEVKEMIDDKDMAILSYSVVPNIKDNIYGRNVQITKEVMPTKEQTAVAEVAQITIYLHLQCLK